MSDELRDLVERAAWTFVQAALAVLVVGDTATYKAALVAGVAAVLSIVKTHAQHRVRRLEESVDDALERAWEESIEQSMRLGRDREEGEG